MSVCKECGIELTDDNWNKSLQKSNRCICKNCYNLHCRNYRKLNKEKLRQIDKNNYIKTKNHRKKYYEVYYTRNIDKYKNQHCKYNHNITLEDKELMIKNQNNKCSICGKDFKNISLAHIDHNHNTQIVRELLCRSCNLLLGFSYENIDTLKQAIKYLKKHNKQKSYKKYKE